MGILGQLIHIPTAEQWPLIQPLILLMLVFLLPFTGLLLVSGATSLIYRMRGDRAVAQEIIDIGIRHPASWMVFGLLPLITLFFLLQQYLYGSDLPIGDWVLKITGLLAVGFVLLFLYRRSMMPPLGALGVLLLMGGAYHLNATLTLLADPEKWPFVKLPLPFLFSIQPVVHFTVFLAGAVAFAGACILIALFAWPEREVLVPEESRREVGLVARVMLLAGLLPIPLLLVWDFYTAPSHALRPEVFTLAGWMIGVLLLLGLFTIAMLIRGHTRYAWPAFVLSFAFLGLFIGKQQTQASVGNEEHELIMLAQLETARERVVAAREELYASSMELAPDAGMQIFNQQCSACHAFDRRVVGPPYNDVLPKYGDDLEQLAGFIYSPVKVDTDYPAMPAPGLRRAEARAVAEYLLIRLRGEEPGGEGVAPGGPDPPDNSGLPGDPVAPVTPDSPGQGGGARR